jgi:hypothetical protein
MHIVFSGEGKSSTNGKTGIDTRGIGGYFIAPPSIIKEGDYAGAYSRIDDWSRIPAIIPAGLMEKLFPKQGQYDSYENTYSNVFDGKKQLSKATVAFMTIGAPKGERNATLFKALADFAGCGYTKEEAKDVLLAVSQRIGLPDSEFFTVLDHAYSKPRTASIPDSIQEKLSAGGKDIAGKITYEEQSVMEDALLACIIKNNDLVPVINDILFADDFQVLRNRIIYKTIVRLYNNDIKVDLITVSNEINKTTDKIKLDEISKMLAEYNLDSDMLLLLRKSLLSERLNNF